MKQLSGLEASFLALESPPQTGHLASPAIYQLLCKRADTRTARVVH